MMRQRLENDELEKAATKKDKKIEKLQKQLQKEKEKAFKHKHQLHEWQRGERTQDDPTGQLPNLNWSEEYKKRREEAEQRKQVRAKLSEPIVVQPDAMPKLNQAPRRGQFVIDLTESPELTPTRPIKTEPVASTSSASQGPATVDSFKRKFEDEQRELLELQARASPSQSVFVAPATKKVKTEPAASSQPRSSDAIVITHESPERALDFTRKTLSVVTTITNPTTTSTASTQAQPLDFSRKPTTTQVSTASTSSAARPESEAPGRADPVVGLTGQPKLKDPPKEFFEHY